MFKRLADWLEKMSVGFIVAAIFQQILVGKVIGGIILVGVGVVCIILSLYLTYIHNQKN